MKDKERIRRFLVD